MQIRQKFAYVCKSYSCQYFLFVLLNFVVKISIDLGDSLIFFKLRLFDLCINYANKG